MAKFTKELQKKIVSLVESDTYSISEICDQLRISRRSFYLWKDKKAGFSEAISRAEMLRDDKMRLLARRSLRKKLEGYTLTDIRDVYVPDEYDPERRLTLQSRVVRKRQYAPDTQAIKMVLMGEGAKKEAQEEEEEAPSLNITVRNREDADEIGQFRDMLSGGARRSDWEDEDEDDDDDDDEDDDEEEDDEKYAPRRTGKDEKKDKSPSLNITVRNREDADEIERFRDMLSGRAGAGTDDSLRTRRQPVVDELAYDPSLEKGNRPERANDTEYVRRY
jgi:AcrR family transcriptional regulator